MDTGNLSGVARPAPHLRRALQHLHHVGAQIPLETAIEEAIAVESLAALLKEAVAASTDADTGEVDYCLTAAHVLKVMRAR